MSKLYNTLVEEFEIAFDVAVQRDENKDADGYINWDYVDADVTMYLNEVFGSVDGPIYEDLFNEFVEGYIEREEAVYIAA